MCRYLQAHSAYLKDYDAVARRGNADLDFNFVDKAAAKASLCKDSIPKVAPVNILGKTKFIPAPRVAGSKNDSIFSQRSNGSGGQTGSTGNLLGSLSGKENEVLADLNNIIEHQKADKNPQLEILRAERDFYYSKLRDIDHILDVFTDNNAEALINNIREVLYLTPEKIAIVCENGDIKIKSKAEDDVESKENRDYEGPFIVSSTSNVKDRSGKTTKQSQRGGGEIMVIEDEESGQEILNAGSSVLKGHR